MPVLPTRILLVEDNPGDARLLREVLAENPESSFELTHCETMGQVLEFFSKVSPMLSCPTSDCQILKDWRQCVTFEVLLRMCP